MKHPLHATDRCCRICYAMNVIATSGERVAAYITDPQERAERRRKASQAAKVATLIRTWLPGGGVADWRHDQYDRAHTRTAAGLAQLHESTGERDG